MRHLVAKLTTRQIGKIDGLKNLPARGPYIVAANHVSFAEPFVISAVVTSKAGAKVYSLTREYIWNIFHFLGLADWLGMIRIDPAQPSQCLDLAVDRLAQGGIVVIFPEGTRVVNHVLGKGKTGAARLALRSGAPVVPIGYRGKATKAFWSVIWHFLFRPKDIELTIGTPLHFIRTATVDDATLHQITERVMKAISDLSGKPYPY